MDDMSKLNYEAAEAIKRGEYDKAMNAVVAGSGDMHLLAMLAIARELANISNSVYGLPGSRA